jgi:probable rRNA maturation factor
MIDIENKTNIILNESILKKIAFSLTPKEIELVITDENDIREINKQYRGIDKSTDVLSFPYEDIYGGPIGSIIISSKHVEDKATELGHSTDDEIALLFIHGLLHVLGFDHETDNGQMREEEIKLIKKFHLPDSLIIRNT